MLAHSSVNGKCANYLTKQLVWQELFPDSLLDRTKNEIENLELLTIKEISGKYNPHLNQFTSPTGSGRKKWETARAKLFLRTQP